MSSEDLNADMAADQQPQRICSTPVQKGLDLKSDALEGQLPGSAQPDSASAKQLPSFAPTRVGRPLDTPFAEACAESPFEAPSPRDLQLFPAEEQLVPASGQSRDIEIDLKQASGRPRSLVLADRSKTEQILWKPVRSTPLNLIRSAPSCCSFLTISHEKQRLAVLSTAFLWGKSSAKRSERYAFVYSLPAKCMLHCRGRTRQLWHCLCLLGA